MAWMLLALLVVGPRPAPDTVVICPAQLRPALTPWLDYRQDQGHELVVLPTGTAEAIRLGIAGMARGGRLQNVVLVGDVPGGNLAADEAVPTTYGPAKVNVEYGSEPTLASDGAYGDLNQDGVPDLAVGRLSADTPADLAEIVAKILAYERSADFGLWRREVHLVAGVGGLGALIDRAIESATRYFVNREIPAGLAVSVTQASWQSPFCPGPPRFREATIERINRGAWFWVYMGHGSPGELDWVPSPDSEYPIFSADDVGRLDAAPGLPVAVFLACYTGAIDARRDCLAERMLAQGGGPVAVLAASRVSMPYGMAVLAHGLMDEIFHRRAPTLGLAILHAKQRMLASSPGDDPSRAMIDSLAGTLSPHADLLPEERAEHARMFHLLGDPLLRMRHPEPVEVRAASEIEPGSTLEVSGVSPLAGRCRIELAVPRGQLTFPTPRRTDYPRDAADWAVFEDEYRRAGDDRLAWCELTTAQGAFSAELLVPANATGACVVRVFIEGTDGCAIGAAEVNVGKRVAGDG